MCTGALTGALTGADSIRKVERVLNIYFLHCKFVGFLLWKLQRIAGIVGPLPYSCKTLFFQE